MELGVVLNPISRCLLVLRRVERQAMIVRPGVTHAMLRADHTPFLLIFEPDEQTLIHETAAELGADPNRLAEYVWRWTHGELTPNGELD